MVGGEYSGISPAHNMPVYLWFAQDPGLTTLVSRVEWPLIAGNRAGRPCRALLFVPQWRKP